MAPVGALRWKEPQPAVAWTTPLDATHPGQQCPQVLPVVNFEVGDENCLFVNVFAPDPTPRRALPVMVWIHGGGFTVGSGLDDDPTALVARTGVVVVTFNYRLGALGFLAHPALTAETADHAAGNLGIQDQQAALRWVRRNVRAFGGNPKNVTIFGESAGCISVCSQLVSPGARGLFRRAITESGPCAVSWPTPAQAEAQGTRFADVLGCSASAEVLACLRGKSAHEVLQALPPDPTFLFNFSANWVPTGDGVVLPADPAAAVRGGKFQRVPLIIGENRDEGRLFVGLAYNVSFGATMPHPLTADEWAGRVDAYFGPTLGPMVREHYPIADYPDPGAAFGQAVGDAIVACPAVASAQEMAKRTPVFFYQFDHAPNPFVLPMVGIDLGAFHSAELPYVFHGPVQSSGPIVFTSAEQTLADLVADAWARFATKGRPGAKPSDWPRFKKTAKYLSLDTPVAVKQDPKPDLCAFWAAAKFVRGQPR